MLSASINFEIQRDQLCKDLKIVWKMSGNQRNHATNPNQGFYRPHGNPHFGQRNHRVQFNPEYPPPGMHAQHAPVHVPQRNPNWGRKNPHVPFNPAYPPTGMRPPHPPVHVPQSNPNWGNKNPRIPFNRVPPPQRRNPTYPPAPTPHMNPNWGPKKDNVPPKPASPPQETITQDPPAPSLEQKNYSHLFNPAFPFIPSVVELREIAKQFPRSESTDPQSANQSPQLEKQDNQNNQENVAASEDQASNENAEDIIKEITDLRNQLMEKDAYLSKLKKEKREARRDRGDKLHRLNVKNIKLVKEVKFRTQCERKVVTLREELKDLNEAAEAKQPKCKEREKEAHIQALNKLALLKKELQEKTLYNLQLAQRLKLEEDAEKDLKHKMEEIQIPLETAVNGISGKPAQSFSANEVQLRVETQTKVSEPEVVNNQVEAEETDMFSAPQDLNGWPQNHLSEPEVVWEQAEYERTDAIIAPQTENEEPRNAASELHVVSEQEEAEETDTTILDFLDTGEAQDLRISQEEVSPPSPSEPVPSMESGHEDREEPEALPSEQTKAQKPSLWKRFKKLFKPRHRNHRDKENQG